MNLQEAKNKLEKYDQLHILKYFEQLSQEQQLALLEQIANTDLECIKNATAGASPCPKGAFSPLAALELDEIEKNKALYRAIGLDAITQNKVGAVLLAGGMGTRLGSDNPKGMYNVGVTKDLYIFECLINNLMVVVKEVQTYIHLFVMTSEKNHEATTSFFAEKNYFGYHPDYIHFFKQEMAAATDYQGHIYLEEKGRMATSPNGNGGWFVSMQKAGLGDLLHQTGIEWLNVFSVDNVLQKIADPIFVGATIQKNCAVGSKVVRKASPDEKVGVMCLEDGKPSIVEYYELTEQMRDAKNEKGDPAYNFGVILNYLFGVSDLERLASGSLPLHIVEKKIPYLNEEGILCKPEVPNGYKYEQLVLDMIHQLDSCLPFEVVREKEFAPIKNATGVDSVETARALLVQNGITL